MNIQPKKHPFHHHSFSNMGTTLVAAYIHVSGLGLYLNVMMWRKATTTSFVDGVTRRAKAFQLGF